MYIYTYIYILFRQLAKNDKSAGDVRRVKMPSYEELIQRRDRILPTYNVTSTTFTVEYEDIIKSTVCGILSFIEENYPERLNGIDHRTPLKVVAKVIYVLIYYRIGFTELALEFWRQISKRGGGEGLLI